MCLQLPTFRKQYDTSKRRELFTNRDKHNISKDLNPPSSLFYFALSFQLRPYGCKSIYPNIQKGNNNSEAFKGYKSLQRELCCLFYIYEKYEEHQIMGAQNSHKSRSQLKHSRRQNGDTKRVQQQGPTNVRRLSIKFRLPPTTRRQRFLHLCSRAPLHCHVESRQRLLVEVFFIGFIG